MLSIKVTERLIESRTSGDHWKILVVAYLCTLAYAFVFQSLPPVLSLIIAELHISHAQAGLLMSLFALPGIFLSIPGGLLSDYYGMRKMGILSLVLMILGTGIAAFGNAFTYLCLGRFLSGIGALILSIIAPQLLSQWFIGRELGRAMGIYNTAMPVGTIICFNTLGVLGKSFGWQSSILVGTLVSTVVLAAFLLIYRPPPLGRKNRLLRLAVCFPASQGLDFRFGWWGLHGCGSTPRRSHF